MQNFGSRREQYESLKRNVSSAQAQIDHLKEMKKYAQPSSGETGSQFLDFIAKWSLYLGVIALIMPALALSIGQPLPDYTIISIGLVILGVVLKLVLRSRASGIRGLYDEDIAQAQSQLDQAKKELQNFERRA